MQNNFITKSILVSVQDRQTGALLEECLNTHKFQLVTSSKPGDDIVKICRDQAFDLILTDHSFENSNDNPIIEAIRNNENPNTRTPIILLSPQSVVFDYNKLRRTGFTDLLLLPFCFDDLKNRLEYIFKFSPYHTDIQQSIPAPKREDKKVVSDPNQDRKLVYTLLDHYMRHHEIVLKKLEFAQNATLKSIEEVRCVRKELTDKDNTNLSDFSRFEKMWADIIDLFIQGGVSEDDIFQIEARIKDVPSDIKRHYDQLTQQDKSFLTMIEALNHNAYRKAREIALDIQAKPNPMTGKTEQDYKIDHESVEEKDDEDIAFLFSP